MKTITFILITFLSLSCANQKTITRLNYKGQGFHAESLLRYRNIDSESLQVKHGLKNCYRKNFNSAKKLQRTELSKNKNNANYWNAVGTCHFLNNRPSIAKFYFNKAYQLDKNSPITLNNIAITDLYFNNTASAINLLKEAFKNNHFETPRFNLMLIYMEHLDVEKAKEHINYFTSKYPNDPEIIIQSAIFHLLQNNVKKSIALFSKLSKKYMEREDVAYYFSKAYYLNADYLLSLETIKKMKTTLIIEYVVRKRAMIQNIAIQLKKEGHHGNNKVN